MTDKAAGPDGSGLSEGLGAGAEANGTFACPICGHAEPHGHPGDVIAAYRDDQVRGDGWTSTIKARPKRSGWYLCREVTIPRQQNQDESTLQPQLSWFLWVREGAARDIETAVPEVLYYEALDQRWSLRNLLGNATISGAERRYRVYASPRYWREVPSLGTPEAPNVRANREPTR